MGDPVRIVDLAQDLIRLSGFEIGDIPIIFSGLRPGEKLIEELWEAGATVTPTASGDIVRIDEPSVPLADADAAIDELIAAAVDGDGAGLARRLARLVPTFAPPIDPGAAPAIEERAEPSRTVPFPGPRRS